MLSYAEVNPYLRVWAEAGTLETPRCHPEVRKLITIPAYLRAGLKLYNKIGFGENVDRRFLGQIVLRLLTKSPLSPLWKVAEVGEGPISTALSSLQGPGLR
jgi:hypothetical protein